MKKIIKLTLFFVLTLIIIQFLTEIKNAIPHDIYFGYKPKGWMDPVLFLTRYSVVMSAYFLLWVNISNTFTVDEKRLTFAAIVISVLIGLGGLIHSAQLVVFCVVALFIIGNVRFFLARNTSIKTSYILGMVVFPVIFILFGLVIRLLYEIDAIPYLDDIYEVFLMSLIVFISSYMTFVSYLLVQKILTKKCVNK